MFYGLNTLAEDATKLIVLQDDNIRRANDEWEKSKTRAQICQVMNQKANHALACVLLDLGVGYMPYQTRQELMRHHYNEFYQCDNDLGEILQEYARGKVISSAAELRSRSRQGY